MLQWNKVSEKLPEVDPAVDWDDRSGQCLIKDDWDTIRLARLKFYLNEWDEDCPPDWRLDGRDDYLYEPKGELQWILVSDLLKGVKNAEEI